LLDDGGIEFAGSEVVQEEERSGPLHCDVVDAVIHQIAADGVVDAEVKCQFELGADAVGGADKDGFSPLFEVELKERSEATDAAQNAAGEGSLGKVLDTVFGSISRGDIDTGVSVGDGLACGYIRGLGRGFSQDVPSDSSGLWSAETGRNA